MTPIVIDRPPLLLLCGTLASFWKRRKEDGRGTGRIPVLVAVKDPTTLKRRQLFIQEGPDCFLHPSSPPPHR
ncbi:hypothetical protein CesoFtcFv8_014295 [Champsocephalus esox]|uniref:Uncharacterized protein n=1 Tax=Champsocephalus esox TaxID=159716 RepID=A0AAN8GTH7_9TELE|nr:hypothetical protein CesoFtcFv8_014295 [Champsocephalus esox]